MCRPMLTSVYTRWGINSETSRFIPRQNKTRSFEKLVMSYFQQTRPGCKILRASTLQADRRKLNASKLMGFVLIAILCLKHWVVFTTFVPVESSAHPSLKTISDVAVGKKELDELRREYIQEKGFTVIEMWECEWWRFYKTTTSFELHIQEHFPYRQSLREHQLLEGIKKGNLFGYVQCDIEVPEQLRANFANFPPIFKNSFS